MAGKGAYIAGSVALLGLGRAGLRPGARADSPRTMASIWVAFFSFCWESFLRLMVLREVRVLPLGMDWISKILAILGWSLACPFFSGFAGLSGVLCRPWWDGSGRVSWWWLGGMGLYRVLSGGLVLESISISSSWARRAASCTEAESTGWSQASSQPSATQPRLGLPGLTWLHPGSLISSGDPCKHPRVPLPERQGGWSLGGKGCCGYRTQGPRQPPPARSPPAPSWSNPQAASVISPPLCGGFMPRHFSSRS